MTALAFGFELALEFDPSLRYDTLSGGRGFSRLVGGSIEGPRISARIQPDGGDFELLRPDGIIELDGRYIARTDDGQVLYLQNRGYLRADGSIRCAPRIEAPPGHLGWLSCALVVGIGARDGSMARIRCYEAP